MLLRAHLSALIRARTAAGHAGGAAAALKRRRLSEANNAVVRLLAAGHVTHAGVRHVKRMFKSESVWECGHCAASQRRSTRRSKRFVALARSQHATLKWKWQETLAETKIWVPGAMIFQSSRQIAGLGYRNKKLAH